MRDFFDEVGVVACVFVGAALVLRSWGDKSVYFLILGLVVLAQAWRILKRGRW